MLQRFFVNDQRTVKPMRYTGFGAPRTHEPDGGHTDKWRFKGHAEEAYWKYVCYWSRSARKPSDLGFPDGKFTLTKLIENVHMVEANTLADGMLFPMAAVGWREATGGTR